MLAFARLRSGYSVATACSVVRVIEEEPAAGGAHEHQEQSRIGEELANSHQMFAVVGDSGRVERSIGELVKFLRRLIGAALDECRNRGDSGIFA